LQAPAKRCKQRTILGPSIGWNAIPGAHRNSRGGNPEAVGRVQELQPAQVSIGMEGGMCALCKPPVAETETMTETMRRPSDPQRRRDGNAVKPGAQ
jgi:hypothetical protein